MTVRVAPHLGEPTSVTAKFPHPLGEIHVQLQRNGESLSGSATLAPKPNGIFVWRGKEQALHPGVN